MIVWTVGYLTRSGKRDHTFIVAASEHDARLIFRTNHATTHITYVTHPHA